MPDRKYEMYMQSPRWQMVRQTRFALDNYKCVCCGRPMDLECHHLSYRNLGHEDILNDLVTLCKLCHEDIEQRKKDNDWGIKNQLVYIFIRNYKGKDVLYGGKENLNVYATIEKYWEEMVNNLHRTEIISYKTEIQNFFARKKEAFIKDCKNKNIPADYLRSKGISEGQIHKYYYSKEGK